MENQIDETKFMDFEQNKVQVLTLDQLKKTHEENGYDGLPLKGIYHWQLIQQIKELAEANHFDVEIYDLFAAHNRDRAMPGVTRLPKVEETYGEHAVEAHILRRVYANIRLTNYDDDQYTTNLAVAFHQKGIQVGFGNMVKICHNQCMLGADNYCATYSDKGQGRSGEKSTIEEIMQIVGGWLTNAEQKVLAEREKIEQMKKINIEAQEMFTIIGMLTTLRVKCDSQFKEIRENVTYPLNNTQINQLTEDMLLRYNRNNKVTVWDLYDGATQCYKATSMDIPALLPQNRAMSQFIDERWF